MIYDMYILLNLHLTIESFKIIFYLRDVALKQYYQMLQPNNVRNNNECGHHIFENVLSGELWVISSCVFEVMDIAISSPKTLIYNIFKYKYYN